jgi:hypothetical protein
MSVPHRLRSSALKNTGRRRLCSFLPGADALPPCQPRLPRPLEREDAFMVRQPSGKTARPDGRDRRYDRHMPLICAGNSRKRERGMSYTLSSYVQHHNRLGVRLASNTLGSCRLFSRQWSLGAGQGRSVIGQVRSVRGQSRRGFGLGRSVLCLASSVLGLGGSVLCLGCGILGLGRVVLCLGCSILGPGRVVLCLGCSILGLGRSVLRLSRSVLGLGRSSLGQGLSIIGPGRIGLPQFAGSLA